MPHRGIDVGVQVARRSASTGFEVAAGGIDKGGVAGLGEVATFTLVDTRCSLVAMQKPSLTRRAKPKVRRRVSPCRYRITHRPRHSTDQSGATATPKWC